MQLRHVRYFVATADAGTVSGAAASVHVTQPALSRQLRQLEADLGVALFDRSAGRLRLSRTGRELLPAARALLDAAGALEAAASFHAHGRVERVVIAAPTVTLTDLVAPFVASMAPDEPVVDVRAADGVSTAQMLAGGADLAIGTGRPRRGTRFRALATLPVWAYVPGTDPWAGRGRVGLGELLERTIVGLPATFTAREALDAAVRESGASYGAVIEAANSTVAQALAASGRGVAVVSDDPRFDLVPLAVDLAGVRASEPSADPARLLSVRLVAAWDAHGVAAGTLEVLARRLGAWIRRHYPPPGAVPSNGRGG